LRRNFARARNPFDFISLFFALHPHGYIPFRNAIRNNEIARGKTMRPGRAAKDGSSFHEETACILDSSHEFLADARADRCALVTSLIR